jgi:hypothetical protein
MSNALVDCVPQSMPRNARVAAIGSAVYGYLYPGKRAA